MADSEARKSNGFLVFLGCSAAIAAVIVFAAGLLAREPKVATVDGRRAQERLETRLRLEKADFEQLTTASWVDKEKGIVRLPVGDAMKLVAVDLAGKKPAPSQVKVDAPLPMPPPYDPNSKEPPVFPLPSAPQGAVNIHFEAKASSAPVSPPPAPVPAAATPPAAAAAPAGNPVAATSAPDRSPLIHFTENSESKK